MERDQLEESGVDGGDKIKKDLQEMRRNMDWIDLAQDRDTWQALRNSVQSLQVP